MPVFIPARHERLQYRDQRIEAVMKHHPDTVETNFGVTVDETMPHGRDVTPGNFVMGGLGRSRNLARRLADHLQGTDRCVLVQPAAKRRSFVEAFDKNSARHAPQAACREEAPHLVQAIQP
jgi:hypothetical protein